MKKKIKIFQDRIQLFKYRTFLDWQESRENLKFFETFLGYGFPDLHLYSSPEDFQSLQRCSSELSTYKLIPGVNLCFCPCKLKYCGGTGIFITVSTNTVQLPVTKGTITDSGSVYTGLLGVLSRYIYRTGKWRALAGWPSAWLECWFDRPMCVWGGRVRCRWWT